MIKQRTVEERLYLKVREQLKARRVGFLLGAGASFLNGAGYPLSTELWQTIRPHMLVADRDLIDAHIAYHGCMLEQALDDIEHTHGNMVGLRDRVTSAIAKAFIDRKPSLSLHRSFVNHLAARIDKRIPVFTLNYDMLLELAADAEELSLIDGFSGIVECFFRPSIFIDFRATLESRRGKSVPVANHGIINLYKLHGSLGWFVDSNSKLKRIRPDMPCPSNSKHLMVPPQYRKASDTGITPYATIWSEFRAHLSNESTRLLNRLVCVGYGFGDGHVNAVIESALARKHFTLVVLTKALEDTAFVKLQRFPNVIIVTEKRSSLYGEECSGLNDAWSFEWLSKEV
jgi:hypothetical protein